MEGGGRGKREVRNAVYFLCEEMPLSLTPSWGRVVSMGEMNRVNPTPDHDPNPQRSPFPPPPPHPPPERKKETKKIKKDQRHFSSVWLSSPRPIFNDYLLD